MRAKAGPVARLIRGLDNTVLVEFGELAIFFERNDGDILLESPGDGDLAHIRLEAWDSPPPEPDTAWIPVENTTIEGGTGFVAVGSVAEDATERFVIGPPHFLYGLTAHSQPAGELPETGSEEELEQAYESREPERWLIRFWPIRDAFDPARHARPDHVDSPPAADSQDFPPDATPPASPAQSLLPGLKTPASQAQNLPPWGSGGVAQRPLPVEEPVSAAVDKPVEVPVSAAADWPAARVAREQAVLEEQLAQQGATMADFLAAKGLPPDTPFDRMAETVRQRSLADMAEREGWPDWWRALAGRYPDLGPQWLPNSHEAVDWPVERRHELARALVTRMRTSAILNRDGARTFVIDIRVNKAEPGDTCRGWRWESAGAPDHETLTVNRRVVYEDVMSGTTLVTGIVTVLWRDEEGYHVRDAEPVEAARLICAEAVWAASSQSSADRSRERHTPATTAQPPATPHLPATAQPSVSGELPATGKPSGTGERPSPHDPPPQASALSQSNFPPPATSPSQSSPPTTGERPVTEQPPPSASFPSQNNRPASAP
jgi:hypothetical protein